MRLLSMTSDHCTSIKATTFAAAEVEYSNTTSPRPSRKTTSSPKIVAATNTNKFMILLSLVMMMCMSTLATAQQECSCAPREYTFRLDFSGTCPPILPNPPNDYFGSGVEEYTCNIGDTPVQDTRERGPVRRYLDNTQLVDIFPELIISTQNVADQTPVIVSSIQFIQSDIKGKPIESSLRTVDKRDGDTIQFISSIVTKPEKIPYRITMVLRGFNAGNQAIQNLFTIDFTNTCGVPTFTEGERIGWVIFDKLTPASETCPAQPLPSRQPTSYYHPKASGYSSKGSKKSSKATSHMDMANLERMEKVSHQREDIAI
eukprot:scaffold150_cov151-Skeletonema_menzelii.AAC.10